MVTGAGNGLTAGGTLRLGEQAGGRQAVLASPGAWCPVSMVTWPDGRTAPFPHIIERGKPGVIAVLRSIGAGRSRVFIHFLAQVAALALHTALFLPGSLTLLLSPSLQVR